MTNEREEAIIATIKEMGVFRTPYPNSEVEAVVSKLIKQSNSDEDCISREAVMEYIKDCTIDLGYENGTNMVLDVISNMPSVKPISPKGDVSVIEDIKADIKMAIDEDRTLCRVFALELALEIIDKHISGKEQK